MMQKTRNSYPGNGASLNLNSELCTGCGRCVPVCPHRVLQTGKPVRIVALGSCMECGACALNCPEKALTVNSGVGCVAAVVNGLLRGTAPSCDCSGGGGACC